MKKVEIPLGEYWILWERTGDRDEWPVATLDRGGRAVVWFTTEAKAARFAEAVCAPQWTPKKLEQANFCGGCGRT